MLLKNFIVITKSKLMLALILTVLLLFVPIPTAVNADCYSEYVGAPDCVTKLTPIIFSVVAELSDYLEFAIFSVVVLISFLVNYFVSCAFILIYKKIKK